MRSMLCVLAVSLMACGAANQKGHIDQSLDFSYIKDGKPGRLSDLQGRPAVLVLMRTSEVVSQIHMGNIAKLYRKRTGTLQFLVLTVEETEAPFVQAYVEFEELPFTIGVAERAVVLGQSSLGVIPAIPYTCFLDAAGRVQVAAPGVLTLDAMKAETDRLLDF